MTGTIGVYDRMSAKYVDLAAAEAPREVANLVATLPRGAMVLDLGCGPGHHAAEMARAGLRVLAVDGSAEMVALADGKPGVEARQATFDDIATLGPVDAVWASFSLLHAPRADLPRHLTALHGICRAGAPMWLGMKLGSGEATDRLGRFYSYYGEDELRALLAAAGFAPGAASSGSGKGLAGDEEPFIVITARAAAIQPQPSAAPDAS